MLLLVIYKVLTKALLRDNRIAKITNQLLFGAPYSTTYLLRNSK